MSINVYILKNQAKKCNRTKNVSSSRSKVITTTLTIEKERNGKKAKRTTANKHRERVKEWTKQKESIEIARWRRKQAEVNTSKIKTHTHFKDAKRGERGRRKTNKTKTWKNNTELHKKNKHDSSYVILF